MSGFAAAGRIASRIDVLESSGSTNAELRGLAVDHEAWPHLSVLLTEDQTAGRGRLDRTWIAPRGTALAISVLLRDLPSGQNRGWIPLLAGAVMADAVGAQLPGHDVRVKWPNDVLVDGRKICGILAEAAADAIIVGAGVNTAMSAAQLPISTATSFAVLGVEVDADRLLADYLAGLSRGVRALVDSGDARAAGVHAAVTGRCATLGQHVRVMLPGDETLLGTATALDDDGRLIVVVDGRAHAVSAGDVVHVRPF